MTDLILPDSRFEMPELFEPGRKPVGDVRIDARDKNGLIDFFLLQSRYKQPFNHVNQARYAIEGSSITFENQFLNKTAGGASDGFSVAERAFTSDFTISFEAKKHIDTNAGILCGKSTTDRIWLYTGNTVYIVASGVSKSWSSGIANIVKKRISFVRRSGICYLYINGIQVGAGQALSGTFYYNRFFDNYGNFFWNGELHWFYSHNRAMSASEIANLHNNPYQFLIPA